VEDLARDVIFTTAGKEAYEPETGTRSKGPILEWFVLFVAGDNLKRDMWCNACIYFAAAQAVRGVIEIMEVCSVAFTGPNGFHRCSQPYI
jgi:hypothetical protein